ncbi:ComF family protein [Wenyingzhuangia sp. IMCC45574]
MNYLKDLRDLFMPKRCLHCKAIINTHQQYLCLDCNQALEYFQFDNFKNNAIHKLFWGRITIKSAAFLYYYHKGSPIQTLLKELKYQGAQLFGQDAAVLFIEQLKDKAFFNSIDIIIPVPLHIKKEQKRGYNQIELFGTTLANSFNVPFVKDGLIKTNNNKSQTKQSKEERYKSVQQSFKVNRKHNLENRHILLIDDVITTGATLTACCKAIQKEYSVNISIITIACVA